MRPLFLIVSIWVMSFVAFAFAEEDKIPLVHVYCSFVQSEKNMAFVDGISVGTFDERWALFVSYLENREQFLKVSDLSEQKAGYEECLSINKEKFEQGEFALTGLQSVQDTKDLLLKADSIALAPVLIASNFQLLDREISTPDMEVVYGFIPESPAPEIPSELLESGVEARRERYALLWNEFTSKLKESYSLQQNGVPVITTEVK